MSQVSLTKKSGSNISSSCLKASDMITSGQKLPDKRCLVLQKEIENQKKNFEQLHQKFERMENYYIEQNVELQLKLQEAHTKFQQLNHENQMLNKRIAFLQKKIKNPSCNSQKMLGQFSVLQLKNSITDSNITQSNTLNFNSTQTERSYSQGSFIQDERNSRTDRLNENLNNEPTDQIFDDSVSQTETIKKSKPILLLEEEAEDDDYCGKKRCIQNYQSLQNLRNEVSILSSTMEDIYLKLNFIVDCQNGLKELADYRIQLYGICKDDQVNFFDTQKSRLLKTKVLNKINQLIENPNLSINLRQSLFQKLEERVEELRKLKESFQEEDGLQHYDYDAQRNQLIQNLKQGLNRVSRWSQSLQRSDKMEEKIEKKIRKFTKQTQLNLQNLGYGELQRQKS